MASRSSSAPHVRPPDAKAYRCWWTISRRPGPVERCDSLAEQVVHYAGGVGACHRHLGLVVRFALEDAARIQVTCIEDWTP